MVHIEVRKGLDIPIEGTPKGPLQMLKVSGESKPRPQHYALNLRCFEDLRFRLFVKENDTVRQGDPLVEDNAFPGRVFTSPAAGVVKEIRRGLKRRLMDIVIAADEKEELRQFKNPSLENASYEEISSHLLNAGLFPYIQVRPFERLAQPGKKPRSIFIKALESAPFHPPVSYILEGKEELFELGLKTLLRLTDGPLHLVERPGSGFARFSSLARLNIHTVSGPHPAANPSLHIQKIDPIRSYEDLVWTINAADVIRIGYLFKNSTLTNERAIGIGGNGILPGKTGFFQIRDGFPIERLFGGRISGHSIRLISGNPLMGDQVQQDDFLGFYDQAFCAFPEPEEREFLHFFRLGMSKYSFSRTYFSGHVKGRKYPFTTSQHGEKRAFIDSTLYDKVMPLHVPTMQLVKAILAEDYDLADELGLLQVAPEDFALPSFVCPSKIEMTDIIRQGLRTYSKEVLH